MTGHSDWGTPISFRCIACGEERSGVGGSVPAGPGVPGLAACRPCWGRMHTNAAFKRRAVQRAAAAAMPVAHQRIADALGVDPERLRRAIAASGPRLEGIDERMSMPQGAVLGTVMQYLASAL